MDTYLDLIEGIRESRRRISEECSHDLDEYMAYMKTFNARYANQVELFQRLPGVAVSSPVAEQPSPRP